jgi:hypothetical protein
MCLFLGPDEVTGRHLHLDLLLTALNAQRDRPAQRSDNINRGRDRPLGVCVARLDRLPDTRPGLALGRACCGLDQRTLNSKRGALSGVGDQTQLGRVGHGGVRGQDPHGVAESTGPGRHKVTVEAVPAALVGL